MDMHEGLRKRVVVDGAQETYPLLGPNDQYDKFAKPERRTALLGAWQPTQRDYIIAAVLTFISLWTRLYKISWADYVVWDEAHFGKFASYYIKREFYFDVHPPLGKMLNGLAGLLAGYNGTFPFESGHKYPEELNYGVMRVFNGLFGAFTVPLAYFTAINLHMSRLAAVVMATMTMLGIINGQHLFLPVGGSGFLQPVSPLVLVPDLAWGSRVSLKNNGRGGGLLHSHVQRYPTGSEQQQITCYHHKDSNNEWIVTRPWDDEKAKDGPQEPEEELIQSGDIVRLVHAQTGRNLHSHPVKAPITTSENEVSCYGNWTIGDRNDLWKVEKVDDIIEPKSKHIRSLTTRMRFRHIQSGCLLRSHGVTLPQWGFKQMEVVCQKKGENDSPNNMWNIEQHFNEKLPAGGPGAYKSKFFKDFIDLNVAMWTSNNALTPDPDKEPDQLTSAPYQWPLMLVGLRMCGWGDSSVKFWLIGNPVVWWGALLGLIIFALAFLGYAVRAQRKINDWDSNESWDDFYFAAKVGIVGWLLHYAPFWIMGRVT
ncbi:Protein O-mannosyltransferase 2 [Borealophlyctis nickersoniae]|nr:Protein O-mannosyltransferase 2 [Borealophlyctis nickersoniae]